jgi:putative aldouronate transport system substrate-binding protein
MLKKALITFGILSALLISCSTPELLKEEPVVFSVLFNQTEANLFQEDWLILEEYKNRQNVSLDIRAGDNADFNNEIIRTLESGNIPDIILKVWPNTIESYAINGILLPFSDYEDLMPNFMAYIEEHDLHSELDKIRLDNGKYYILPGFKRKTQVQQWIYRRDIFEKNNLEMPKTYDELFDSLVLLKEIYPNTTPITASWGGAHLFAMMGAGYGIPAGWAGTRDYNYEKDQWLFSPATDSYKELLTYLNRCYDAGVLDPAIFTQGDEEFINKLVDSSALVTVTWVTSGFSNWNEKLEENGFPDGEWAPLLVPESTIGITALPPVDPFRKGLVVPSRVINEPYFEDLLKFLDWAVYSEEGMILTTWGIEGLTFENISDGKVFLPEIITPKNASGTIEISKEYGLDIFFNLVENEEFEDYKKPPEIAAFLENSLNAEDAAEMDPQLKLNSDAINAVQLINEKIDPYITETFKHFITGELSVDQDWDEYLLEIEKRGYKTLEEIWNNTWKQQNK